MILPALRNVLDQQPQKMKNERTELQEFETCSVHTHFSNVQRCNKEQYVRYEETSIKTTPKETIVLYNTSTGIIIQNQTGERESQIQQGRSTRTPADANSPNRPQKPSITL